MVEGGAGRMELTLNHLTKSYDGGKSFALNDFTKTFDELVSALESGKISESRIDESVARILKMKSGFKKNN